MFDVLGKTENHERCSASARQIQTRNLRSALLIRVFSSETDATLSRPLIRKKVAP